MSTFTYVAYGVLIWAIVSAFFIGLMVGSQLPREARDE
jgi:hypothetical protein